MISSELIPTSAVACFSWRGQIRGAWVPYKSASMFHYWVYLSGTFCARRKAHVISLPTEKTRSLLAYLILHPGAQSREKLSTLFWGETSEIKAHGSLRKALTFLRKTFSSDLILADPENVQLNPAVSVWVDVLEFERQARKFLADVSPDPNTISLDLYRGDLLCDFYDDWILPLRQHYRSLYIDVLLRIVETLRAQSKYKSAIEHAQKILMIDVTNECAHQHLMFCHITLGERNKALQQYEACQRALQEELAVEPSRSTQALYNWIKQSDSDPSSMAARLTNLPIPVSSFVGRHRELATVKQLISTARLVTLTGAGGSGKTRLAIHASTDLIDSYRDGVWWVELAPLTDPSLVPSAVATALGISPQTDQPLIETLAHFLSSRQNLLVLDNCEHLVDACAQLTEHLLFACSGLKILCTSRESLGLAGEVVWQVPSLSLPDPKSGSFTELLMQYEGIRLFTERASAVKPDFTLTEQNASAVVQICGHLDGIPLAIELAAARVKMMSVEQIASRLNDRFHLLTAENRTSQTRHQTLRAAIDWSYHLLSEAERQLFCRLSVFSGGWTLDAAESVCPKEGEEIKRKDILNLLARLVDKSLVINNDGQRYGMLETIKQYAAERLAQAGEMDWLHQQYLGYYLRMANVGDEKIRGSEQLLWLKWFKTEYDNLSNVMEAALGSTETIEKGCDLVCSICWYWKMVGDYSIMKHWLEIIFSRKHNLEYLPTKAKLLFNVGLYSVAGLNWFDNIKAYSMIEESLNIWNGLGSDFTLQSAQCLLILGYIQKTFFRNDKGYDYMNQAVATFEEKGNVWWHAWALNFLGMELVEDFKDIQNVLKILEEETTLWKKTGDQCTSAVVLWDLGFLALRCGDLVQAQEYFKESLQRYKKFGAKSYIFQALLHLGDTARALKQYDKAEIYYKEGISINQIIMWDSLYLQIYMGLGYVLLAKGDLQEAKGHFLQALRVSREFDLKTGKVRCIGGCAAIVGACGMLEQAGRLFGAYFAQYESLKPELKTSQMIKFLVDQMEIDGYVDVYKTQISKLAFEKAWNEGNSLSLDEAIDELLRLGD